MKYNKDKYKNRDVRTVLKDGRIVFTKNSRDEFYLEHKNGSVLPINKSYYDKVIVLAVEEK
jgi:hypothetical protein|tara:strand:- start:63 stop:245 length:183 start_codon:yes stop_codon:yes gene_type:complete